MHSGTRIQHFKVTSFSLIEKVRTTLLLLLLLLLQQQQLLLPLTTFRFVQQKYVTFWTYSILGQVSRKRTNWCFWSRFLQAIWPPRHSQQKGILSMQSLCRRLTQLTSRNACFSTCWRLCSLSASCMHGLHAESRLIVGPPPKLNTYVTSIIWGGKMKRCKMSLNHKDVGRRCG